MQEKTIWKRKNSRQKIKQACNFQKIQKEILKSKKSNKGTSNKKIVALLKCVPNFIGCFAEDQVSNIIFNSFPCLFIVNIDSSSMPGSHWLTVGVFKDRVEVFDPLGFKFLNWSRIPCELLKFLHRLCQHRRLILAPRIQADESVLCAFYCIYYCIFRSSVSFSKISEPFHSRLALNDKVLIKLFS